MRLTILFVIGLLFHFSIFSQNNAKEFKSISKRTLQDLHYEVFQGLEVFTLNDEMANIYQDRLDRVSFSTVEKLQGKTIRNLSEVYLINKINKGLKHDKVETDLSLFNPLKYSFMFYEPYDQFFQIDGSTQVIIIKANK
ncbi:hypothetical protein OAT71_00230 [Flavobacteriales bacterium]|jgi:hypothetical protein|nr:hypothetical protein [Flavobacteriales bacterium]